MSLSFLLTSLIVIVSPGTGVLYTLAAALTQLGPSFIKLGQLLSTRADLLGDEITEDLAELQDRLPPFPGTQAKALIEAEFERPLGAPFASFDEKAVAASE